MRDSNSHKNSSDEAMMNIERTENKTQELSPSMQASPLLSHNAFVTQNKTQTYGRVGPQK